MTTVKNRSSTFCYIFLNDSGKTQALLHSSSGRLRAISVRGIPQQFKMPNDSSFKNVSKWHAHIIRTLKVEFYTELRFDELVFHKRAWGGVPPTGYELEQNVPEDLLKNWSSDSSWRTCLSSAGPIGGTAIAFKLTPKIGRVCSLLTGKFPQAIIFAGIVEALTQIVNYIIKTPPNAEEKTLIENVAEEKPGALAALKSSFEEKGVTEADIEAGLHKSFRDELPHFEELSKNSNQLAFQSWEKAFCLLASLIPNAKLSKSFQKVGSATALAFNAWSQFRSIKLSTWAKVAVAGDVISAAAMILSLFSDGKTPDQLIQDEIKELDRSIKKMQNDLSRELGDIRYKLGDIFDELHSLRFEILNLTDFLDRRMTAQKAAVTQAVALAIDQVLCSLFSTPRNKFLTQCDRPFNPLTRAQIEDYIALCLSWGGTEWTSDKFTIGLWPSFKESDVIPALRGTLEIYRGRFLLGYLVKTGVTTPAQHAIPFGNPIILMQGIDGLLAFLAKYRSRGLLGNKHVLKVVKGTLIKFLELSNQYQAWIKSIQLQPTLFSQLLDKYKTALIEPYEDLLLAVSGNPGPSVSHLKFLLDPILLSAKMEKIENRYLLLQSTLKTGFPLSYYKDPMWRPFFQDGKEAPAFIPSRSAVEANLRTLETSPNTDTIRMRLNAQMWQVMDNISALDCIISLKRVAVLGPLQQERFEPLVLAKQAIHTFGAELFPKEPLFKITIPPLRYSITEASKLETEGNVLEAIRFGCLDRLTKLTDADPKLLGAGVVAESRLPLIHYAALCGQVEVCWLLKSKGVSLQDRDAEGNTPAHWAVIGGHFTLLQQLIEWDIPHTETNAQGLKPASLLLPAEDQLYQNSVCLGKFKFFEKIHPAEEAVKKGNYQFAIDLYQGMLKDPNADERARISEIIRTCPLNHEKERDELPKYVYKGKGKACCKEDMKQRMLFNPIQQRRMDRVAEFWGKKRVAAQEELKTLPPFLLEPTIQRAIEARIQKLQTLL